MENSIENLYQAFLKNPFVCTDTRKITPGCIYFALKGDNFNGNTFAKTALEQGASLAVIDELAYNTDQNCFIVPDVLKTLQDLAHFHRMQLDIPCIAITGSNGKTTTKELMAVVLSSAFKTLATSGNLNNHIGVPLTLLSINKTHEIAVIEMGANHQHEIEMLCKIAEPTHGLITNIGKAHLEGFGGIEGVKKGKGELYDFVKSHEGVLFIHQDQPTLVELLGTYPEFIAYGSDPENAISGKAESGGTFLQVKWKKKSSTKEYNIQTQLTGDYNLPNVLAAICVGDFFKVDPENICSAIADYQPGNQRSQVILKGSNTIVLDAYNANPTSMEAALKNFNEKYSGKKIVVLGDMLELGDASLKEHDQIAQMLDKMNYDEVVLVGDYFMGTTKKIKGHYFKNAEEAKEWINSMKFSNASVLIKGSRGLKMEKTLDGF